MKDDLTFVIPAYNAAMYVDLAFTTALASGPVSIIYHDDCSPDNSFTLAEEWRRRHPDRIVVNRNKANLGPTANWQEAAKLVQTPYFIKFDVDDVIHPQYISQSLNCMRNNRSIVVACASAHDTAANVFPKSDDVEKYLSSDLVIGDAEEMTSCEAARFIAEWNPYPYSLTTIFKTETWRKCGGFNPSIRFCGDMEVFFRILQYGNMLYWRDKVGLYRITANGVAQTAMREKTAARDLLRTYAIARQIWKDDKRASAVIRDKIRIVMKSCLYADVRRIMHRPPNVGTELMRIVEDIGCYFGKNVAVLQPLS